MSIRLSKQTTERDPMGKNKQKQSKLALKVTSIAKPKAATKVTEAPRNAAELKKSMNGKKTKLISSSFQQQVQSLQERQFRKVQFAQTKKNAPPQIALAPATLVLPNQPIESHFAQTDALFKSEITAPAAPVVRPQQEVNEDSNRFLALEETEAALPVFKLAEPTLIIPVPDFQDI